MAMTQMQIIQSLGDAMAWFERELAWGVPATELRHLCGRIGELYVAMLTNGQMATDVNQRGYDVVSAANERISVKTSGASNIAAAMTDAWRLLYANWICWWAHKPPAPCVRTRCIGPVWHSIDWVRQQGGPGTCFGLQV